MVVAAVLLAASGATMLLVAIAAAIATVLPWWAGFLIVGAVLLVVAGILIYVAKSNFDKSKTIDVSLSAGAKKSADAFMRGIQKPEKQESSEQEPSTHKSAE